VRPVRVSAPRRPPRSPLFPYTTLFRSAGIEIGEYRVQGHHGLRWFLDTRRRAELEARACDPPRQVQPPEPNPMTHSPQLARADQDRKSTRLNSSHVKISYAVLCLKQKT